jgi:hypothetical protein
MRASRSPSSRTFFIHAVDVRNAESWMLEVVLQIEAQILKKYSIFQKLSKLLTACSARGRPPDRGTNAEFFSTFSDFYIILY